MSRVRLLRVLLGLVFALGTLPALAAQQNAAPGGAGGTMAPPPVVLQSGDAVRITVWRNTELSGEFQVAVDGTLLHPLYRTLRVAGVPWNDVQARLETFLAQFEARPQFVAEPLLRVSVSGEVARSNLYYLRPEATVAEAVALAGGPTERGRRDRALLVREGTATRVPLHGGAAQTARQPLHSGDQVLVERRGAMFREVVAPVIGVAGAIAAIIGIATRR